MKMNKTGFTDKNGKKIMEGMKLKGCVEGEYLVLWDGKYEFVILHSNFRFCEKLTQEIAEKMQIIENTVSRLTEWGYL